LSQDISFSQLLGEVDQGRVREVVIEGPEIRGTFTDGRGFKSYAPNDPTLAQRLYAKGVIVTARPSQDIMQWATSVAISWLPFAALIVVWIFLSRRTKANGQLFGFGQGAALLPTPRVFLADPTYWRGRADEARTVAGRLGDHDPSGRWLKSQRIRVCGATRRRKRAGL